VEWRNEGVVVFGRVISKIGRDGGIRGGGGQMVGYVRGRQEMGSSGTD